jgi:hypothetical protein
VACARALASANRRGRIVRESAELAERLFASDQPPVFDRGSLLLPPEGLRVTSNEDRQIALAWDPVLVGDVAGYAILRASGKPEGPYARVGITKSRFGTVFSDAGQSAGALGDGQTYAYRVILRQQGRSRAATRHSARPEARPGCRGPAGVLEPAAQRGPQLEASDARRLGLRHLPLPTWPGRGARRLRRGSTQYGVRGRARWRPARDVLPDQRAEPLRRRECANRGRARRDNPNLAPDRTRVNASTSARGLAGRPTSTRSRAYEVWRALADGELGGRSDRADPGTTSLPTWHRRRHARYRLQATDAGALVASIRSSESQDTGLALAVGTGAVLSWDPAAAGWTAVRSPSALPDRDRGSPRRRDCCRARRGTGRVTFRREGDGGATLEAPPCPARPSDP